MASKYVDKTSILQVLGCLYKHPFLLEQTDKYFFSTADFTEGFHKIVFNSIHALAFQGMKTIDGIDIENYLAARPGLHKIFNDNKGHLFLEQVKEFSDVNKFEYYFNRIKKFTLLRAFDNYGINVSWFYDTDLINVSDAQAQEDRLDTTSLEEISNLVNQRIEDIKLEFLGKTAGEAKHAGDGVLDLLESLKQVPEVGIPLYGPLINTITRGARLKKFYLRSAPTGVGKALMNGSKVLTPSGYKNIEILKTGEKIFGEDGNIYKVKGVFPQGKKKIFEVEFSNGTVVKCCDEHLWTYQTYSQRNGNSNNWQTKSLKDIINSESLFNQQSDGTKRWRLYIPNIKPLKFEKKDLPIKPYTLGALLGDGGFREKNQTSFTNEDVDVIRKINSELSLINAKLKLKTNTKIDYEIVQIEYSKNSKFNRILETLNLRDKKSNNKFIPDIYKYSSVEDRLEILKGIIDTDGFCNGSSYDIAVVSEQLAKDIKFICESLGFTARSSTKETFYYDENGNKVHGQLAYRLSIKTSDDIQKIHYSKKRESQWCEGQTSARITIRDIRETNEYAYMTCISTTNPTELFITDGGIVTHNTRMMVADSVNFAANEIYDEYSLSWKPNGTKENTLFITTELEIDEVQTMALAFLSAVPEDNILNGEYDSDEQWERVKKAAQILKESPLWIEHLPDFSLRDIESIIRRNVRDNGIKYVAFDYIHSSLKILEEVSQRTNGMKLREDNILFMLAIKIKDLCNELGIFVISATQLNSDWEDRGTSNQNVLRGAKAIADKIDLGIITLPTTQQDQEALQSFVSQSCLPMPNMVHHIYKNRRGKFKSVKLWCTSDLSTCRVKPLFLTDNDYNIINIEDVDIIVKENPAQITF